MEMEEDYSELEGEIVEYTNSVGSFLVNAKVIGCDFDVGLTMIQVNENGEPILFDGKEDYVTCLHGKSSPLYIEYVRNENMTKEQYNKYYYNQFICLIEMIKGGIVDIDELVITANKTFSGEHFNFAHTNDKITSEQCAFNQ